MLSCSMNIDQMTRQGKHQLVQPFPREMPQPHRRLHVLQEPGPPQGFATEYKRCVHAAADERPPAQQVTDRLQDLQHAELQQVQGSNNLVCPMSGGWLVVRC